MISISKIKKIIATKKKWIEKGRRAEFLGSKPHSKGLFFSRSLNLFLEIKLANIIRILVIIRIIKKKVIRIKIIYTIL